MPPVLPHVDLDDTCDRCDQPPAYAARWREKDTTVLLLCAECWPAHAVPLISRAHTVWPIRSLLATPGAPTEPDEEDEDLYDEDLDF